LHFNACDVCGNTCDVGCDDNIQDGPAAVEARLNEYVAKADVVALPEGLADVEVVAAIVL
jgi:hypothetical protein